ncbi:MAG: TolC family protein [Anaeromyxobacteraceae bacterium]|nr:TolC family protein [Anaeromyxobacteraceae bacterium]
MSPSRFFLLALLVLPAGARAAPTLTLDRALSLALDQNPGLLALQSEVAASRARLEGASLLLQSNPELEGAAGPRSTAGTRGTDFSVTLSQRLELFGQRAARSDASRALLGSAEARLAGRRVEVAAEVREGFGRWLGARQRDRIAAEALDLARQALAAAETRQAAGAASRIEVNAARAVLGRAARERSAAALRLASAKAGLLLLLGLDPAEPAEPEGDLALEAPGPVVATDTLVQQALALRPDLQAARLEVDAAAAEHRLAGREALPNPRLGVSYAEEGDPANPARIAQAILAFDLPLFNRNQAARGVAAARQQQAARALEALTRSVRAEVALAASRLASAQAAAQAYAGGLLSGLEENMQLVTEAYRAGKVDFFELLVIRRETLEARNGYVDALEELLAAKAGLSRAIGSIP